MSYTFLATAAFGLEGVAANELKRMNIAARAENGGARFEGSLLDAYRANLCLRTADRVLLVLAEEKVNTFEELFQLVGRIAWERFLPKDASIHVSGKCVRSQLMSVRDCQAISKKAIVQRLMQKLRITRLPETGVEYPIEVEFDEIFTRQSRYPQQEEDQDDEEERLMFDGSKVELSHLALTLAVLELPMRFVCGDACPALDAMQPDDENSTHACQKDMPDQHPFSALQQLLTKDQEV